MASRHTRLSARGNEVAVSSTTTDAPILPIEQIEKLQQIAPHRVDWVFDQTEAESRHRRDEIRRVNTFVFVERLLSLVFALVIATGGLGCAVYLALSGRELTASIIGGGTLAGLVASFLTKTRGRSGAEKKPEA
jgi:hypothetical protein